LQSICPGWLWTTILLLSVFWVVRITGMSHRHPAELTFLVNQDLLYMQKKNLLYTNIMARHFKYWRTLL
jgi:hypothetical protein